MKTNEIQKIRGDQLFAQRRGRLLPLDRDLADHIEAGKPFIIFGCGITGRAVARFLRHRGLKYCLFDERIGSGPDGEMVLSEFHPDAGQWIIASPSFIHHPWSEAARTAGARWLGELDFYSLFASNFSPLIAVTGTNGKTSTTLLLNHLLRKNGIRSNIAGNIGEPIIDFLADPEGQTQPAGTSGQNGQRSNPMRSNRVKRDEISDGPRLRPLICEVSSFQSYGLKYFSPDLTIWTNFSPTHLDVHRNWQEYFMAKWNLVQRTKDRLIVHPAVLTIARNLGLPLPPHLRISTLEVVTGDDRPSSNPIFDFPPQRDNLRMAEMAIENFGLKTAAIGSQLEDFRLPDHRLHRFHSFANLSFWNDSKATNSSAAKAAVKYLSKFSGRLVWLTCGKSKGEDLETFRPILSAVDLVLGFGHMGQEIHRFFGPEKTRHFSDDGQLFAAIGDYGNSHSNEAVSVLLSPGFSSFDRFRSYGERGAWFERSIKTFFAG